MILNIQRSGTPIASFNCAADGIATFTYSLMNEHKIVVSFLSGTALDIRKGDYITFNSIQFTANLLPEPVKTASFGYQYDITFESPVYTLYRKVFMHLDAATFDYNGALPSEIMGVMLTNINSIDPGWTLGDVDDTVPVQNFSFDSISCREALNAIASQYSLEWYCNNKEIHLVKSVGFDTSLSFSYGQGNGLYQLDRKNVTDKHLVTRLFAFGSDKNIDYTYRGGAKKLIFAEKFLEKNIGVYGVNEDIQNFDDIYPHRESTITATADHNTVTDAALDFDLNAQLISGTTAKISFLTGDFAGLTFDISSYDNATKTINFNSYTDDSGYTYPSDVFFPRVGDQYTFVDILMPQTYIDAAEALLKTKAQAYLDENSVPRVQYGLYLDQFFVKQNGVAFNVGDKVTIVDDALAINTKIRVSAISYQLYTPYNITATIADSVGYSVTERVIAKTIDNTTKIKTVDRSRVQDYRIGYQRQQQLKGTIFDTDGYFDSANIKPLSIETAMLSVGAKSQAFQLSGAYFKISDDNLSATATATSLIHNAISIDGLGFTWAIASNTSLSLPTTTTAYYLYAKCSSTELTGVWVVDTAQHLVDSEVGYYWFLVGVIYSVADGYRGLSLTYGYSSINGRTVTAGRIQSLDGNTYFDLDANEIGGRIVFKSGSNGYANISDKPDLSPYDDTTSYVNNTLPGVITGLQDQIDGQIESWFYSGVPTLVNLPASDWTTDTDKDKHLGDLYYNQDDGKGYRFTKVGTTYSWTLLADTDIALALAKADAAQDTADHKRRVFVAEPTTPYDIGDLWVQGSGGDIMRCQTAEVSGAFNSADWILASKYTDDTTANTAIANAATAQSAAEAAQADANTANSAIDDITSDNVLSPPEKTIIVQDYNAITGEQSGIDASATTYGITTEKTAYDNSISDLNTYLATLTAPVLWSDMSGNTNIVGSTFRSNFTSVYTARQTLLNKISSVAKSLADAAQGTANAKNQTFVSATAPTATAIGDLWIDTANGNALKRWSGTAWTAYQDAGIAAANTLAGTKNKTYTGSTTPTGMTTGDIWLDAGNGNVLKRYDGIVWVVLQDGDIATAISNAANAQSTADAAALKTDFIDSTTIAGNVVATGTLLVGDASGANAGVSGVTDGSAKWRFWAGSDYAGRINAPFRVQDDGQVWMEAVHINTRDAANNMRGAVIDSEGGELSLYTGTLVQSDEVTPDITTPDIKIDATNRIVEVSGDWHDANRDIIKMSKDGVVSNASNVPWGGVGTNDSASIVGLLRRRSSDAGDIAAAVVGIDQSSSGAGDSYGGYFNTLYAGGITGGSTFPTGNVTMVNSQFYLGLEGSSAQTIQLPPSPKTGQMHLIGNESGFASLIYGNGHSIVKTNSALSFITLNDGEHNFSSYFFIFNGTYWRAWKWLQTGY